MVAGASFTDMPAQHGSIDWLLVPGGIGSRQEVHSEVMLQYIRSWCDPAVGLALVMSVCTGSALLAAAGVLDGR
jgi:putative intracellular protease/amidase